MSKQDGQVVGTTLVVDNGPPSRRWNLVVMGDGFTAAEQDSFKAEVDRLIAKLKATKPFDELWHAINVYRVDVTSVESGADDPATCADGSHGLGTAARTFFDATFCTDGIRRLLTVDDTLALTTSAQYVPNGKMTIVVVNSEEYGGSGGSVAVYSRHPDAVEIALHEMGHTAFGFADEYEYLQGCASGETGHDRYAGGEPVEPNVTSNLNPATLKWRGTLSAGVALPTMANPNCAACDERPSPVPAGTVGAFEGAHYFHCGVYRPEAVCRMRALDNEFCAVCQAEIKRVVLKAAHLP
jgi:hypothetical protein